MKKEINWKLNCWDLVPVRENGIETVFATNDEKFSDEIVVPNSLIRKLRQKTMDRFVDVKIWERFKEGNFSDIERYTTGNRSGKDSNKKTR